MLSEFKKHGSKVMFPPINSNLQSEMSNLIKDKRGYVHAQMLYPNLSPSNKGVHSMKRNFPSTTKNRKTSVDLTNNNRNYETNTVDGKKIEYFIHFSAEAIEKKRLQ